MKDSPRLTTVCWLVQDTFRQSLAQGIFWVLLAVSVLSIGICLTIHTSGRETMRQGDDNPDFLSRKDSESSDAQKLDMSGVDVASGELTLAFGAIDVPLARDTRSAIHFIELVLAGGVADTLGLLLTLVWTAGFLPSFLEGRNIAVLLAKPAPRWVLILGKYLGVLAFVLFHSVIFVGGTYLAIGVRTGFWDPTYLLSVPAAAVAILDLLWLLGVVGCLDAERRGLRVWHDPVLVLVVEHELRPSRVADRW